MTLMDSQVDYWEKNQWVWRYVNRNFPNWNAKEKNNELKMGGGQGRISKNCETIKQL